MKPDFTKYPNNLMPAIVQDSNTNVVLMLGFMNQEAFEKTRETKKVTFFSRSKNRLWTKGEESGHFLKVTDVLLDCDADTLLIMAQPEGPVCHTGADTCFGEKNKAGNFLNELEKIIDIRKNNPLEGSHISKLFAKGINKISQKVGEEAVELIIEAKDSNDELFLDEAADLLFHYLILLQAKGYRMKDVTHILKKRNKT
jgi:phosphoribosyl-ATP pyrophosphohydrolase/phosphoribosyl-AMP cyclohydrolase